MKIAVITASLGGIDEQKEIPIQDIEFDRYYYTDKNCPYPFQDCNRRLAAKYFKMQAHRFLPGYDIYVWLDGTVQVKSSHFISSMVKPLEDGTEVSIFKHPFRSSVYEEVRFICNGIDKGSEYLGTRYTKKAILRELEFIGPNIPNLYMCGLFARVNNLRVNTLFNEWFMWNVMFSAFDQNQFSKIAQHLTIHTIPLGDVYNNKYFQLTKHSKLQ